ncbi:MAG TPA: 50S ribosomal protein L18 [candidate division Zixibacteria bacterium]|nr:50S ribosomal protein L18 [candidate division Zixibacteria bacterium]
MADKNVVKGVKAKRRRSRVRGKISGTPERPRLTVAKSLKNIYVQVIDDINRVTLASAATNSKNVASEIKDDMNKTKQAFVIGTIIAKVALEKGIEKVVFDKNVSRYHGRVKAVADGARKGGLKL